MFWLNACLPKTYNQWANMWEEENNAFTLFVQSCHHVMMGGFFVQYLRCQLYGRRRNDWQIVPECKCYTDRSWVHPWILVTSVAQCNFWSAIWRRQGIHMTRSCSSINACSKANFAMMGPLLYVKYQVFSNVQSSSIIKTDIPKYHKIHLPCARVEIYKVRHCIICGCVCLSQRNSPSNATHCTFTSNSAGEYGGAIVAAVGHPIQDVTVLGNRN